MHRGNYIGLQALRGIAALAVVCVHVGGPSGYESKVWDTIWLDWMYPAGLLGVDLFFVISGFIMVATTASLATGARTSRSFLLRRASRIYPPYLVATALVFAVFLVRPSLVNSSQGDAGPDVVSSFLLLPQDGSPLLLVGWTLVHELYFYLVFAAALLLSRRYLPLVLGAWGAATIAMHLVATEESSPWLQLGGSLLNLEFLLGAGVAWLVLNGKLGNPAAVLAMGVAGFAVAAWFALPGGLPADWLRVLGLGTALAVILLGVIGAESRLGWTPSRPMVLLGDSSYSLYLTHVPALAVLAVASALLPSGAAFHAIGVVLALAGCIAVGWVYYRLVERPSLALSRRWLARHGERAKAPAVVPDRA